MKTLPVLWECWHTTEGKHPCKRTPAVETLLDLQACQLTWQEIGLGHSLAHHQSSGQPCSIVARWRVTARTHPNYSQYPAKYKCQYSIRNVKVKMQLRQLTYKILKTTNLYNISEDLTHQIIISASIKGTQSEYTASCVPFITAYLEYLGGMRFHVVISTERLQQVRLGCQLV